MTVFKVFRKPILDVLSAKQYKLCITKVLRNLLVSKRYF